jgi:hypothetical protein
LVPTGVFPNKGKNRLLHAGSLSLGGGTEPRFG